MKFYQKHTQLSMWITAFIFIAAVILFKEIVSTLPQIVLGLGKLLSILSPFIIGFIIAFLLYVPCKKFEGLYKKIKKPLFFAKHARGLSIITIYIICVAVLVVLLALIIPWLVKSLIGIYDNRDVYYDRIVALITSYCDADGKIFGIDPKPFYEKLNPQDWLTNIDRDQLMRVAGGVYKFGTALVDVVLAIFSSIYMLASRESVLRSIGKFFTLFTSRKNVKNSYNYLCKISGIFYSYIYSALIDALVVAVSCTVAFLIIGVDYAPLFGFLVGVANLIPYFGAIIAGVAVSAFTLATDGFVTALIVAIVVVVIQQIDCNILQPRIVGHTVGIPPLLTLIAITVGGGLLGFGGIIIGVPIAASIQMIVGDIIEYREKRLMSENTES